MSRESIESKSDPAYVFLVFLQLTFPLYHSLRLFFLFCSNAGNTQPGTIAAAVHQVGNFFERLQVKPLSLGGPPCCKIFWCRCSYAPGKAFLSQCVARVYVAVILQSILIVVRQGLIDTSMEAQFSLLLTLWGLGVTILALSAKMPLDALLNQILLPLPRQQMVAKWRNRQYMIWFVLMGGLHNVRTFGFGICICILYGWSGLTFCCCCWFFLIFFFFSFFLFFFYPTDCCCHSKHCCARVPVVVHTPTHDCCRGARFHCLDRTLRLGATFYFVGLPVNDC